MEPKPAHLGPEYGAQFKDTSIVNAYQYRPPYPAGVLSILIELITDQPRVVLDVGCGTGDLARRLVATDVERVDAVDFSQAMIAKGKTLPGGDHPRLNWMYGRMEEVELQPPYALITAGESLHWMEWDVVLPLFRRILTQHGYLAIVGRSTQLVPWNDDLLASIRRFSTNREYRPYTIIEELERRHIFHKQGETFATPVEFTQSLENYIESFHSRNGLSRDRMTVEAAQAFDGEVKSIVEPFLKDGQVIQYVIGHVEWGTPQV
jgi:ubiquinone/menaquinone biosynthesis C-methylase UbiE